MLTKMVELLDDDNQVEGKKLEKFVKNVDEELEDSKRKYLERKVALMFQGLKEAPEEREQRERRKELKKRQLEKMNRVELEIQKMVQENERILRNNSEVLKEDYGTR